LAVAAALLSVVAAGTPKPPLHLVSTVALPGVSGRIDHLAVDVDQQRLFVAALGNNSIEVVDLRSLARVQSVKGLREPQGIAFLAGARRLVVANGQDGSAEFRDGDDFHTVHAVPLGDDADNVRYDASSHRVFVGYGGGALAAIAEDGKRLAEAKLPGHPESFQLEASGPRIFVNVPSAGRIVVVARDTMTVTASWPVTAAAANYPMALDETGHRLFVACRRPARLLVYDTASGNRIGATATVGDADDLFFDARRRSVYVSGGEGAIDVLRADGAALASVARIPTAPGARTSLFIPEQNRLYVAVPARGGQAAEIRVFEAGT
jgi:DNA-binding beta-propeller fold protein YncE